jgi:UDP-N-acetylmuramate--alanine ligase
MESAALSSCAHAAPERLGEIDLRNLPVHLVGIGGSGMCGLAALLQRCGARVSGSDRCPSRTLTRLQQSGVRVSTEQQADTVPADAALMVVSAAIPPEHPELCEASRRGVRVLKYAEMLGLLMARHHGIAISGTHGKSTTTAWLAFALRQAGCDPSFIVGAECEQLGGGSGTGDGPHFVAEACEYDRSFLNLRPQAATILNIEEDHLDCYTDLAAITTAFKDFGRQVPPEGLIVLNGGDPRCRNLSEQFNARVETFGLNKSDTWRATELHDDRGYYSFAVHYRGEPLGRVRLGIPGRHNAFNALAVIGLARHCDVAWDAVQAALADFRGARRRLESRGEVGGIQIVDDYAHHPTEIRVTLQAARQRYRPTRLWCILQPHQHSRTRFLLADFARSFKLADRVVVPRIFFVRDSERERAAIRAHDLVERIRANGGDAVHIARFEDIVELLARELAPGDLVITMGAGDIWKVADELVRRLRADLQA